jgi:ribA/ribD-fused uncharacterized protein
MTVIDYFGTGSDAGDNSFLSNFYVHDGWTVEHHYQAAKTDDPEWAARILLAPAPTLAKRLGRQAPIRRTWEREKIIVMRTLLRSKFRYAELAEKFIATGEATLIEGNTWGDKFWGQVKGEGANYLGRLLMKVREELQTAVQLTPSP